MRRRKETSSKTERNKDDSLCLGGETAPEVMARWGLVHEAKTQAKVEKGEEGREGEYENLNNGVLQGH